MTKPQEHHLETTMIGEPGVASEEVIAGRYRLLALLGAGGMGRVYRAFDEHLGDVVALKIMRADLASDAAGVERFVQEARLARRVTHKNVARTFDIGEHAGLRFLTMEYVQGTSLAALLDARGAPPQVRAMALGRAILEGLAAAHAVGVVHRDLKPENVLVADDGRVVLTDFGIARDTVGVHQTAGRVMGTPAYMAPEQLEGVRDLDARADIYAFGEIAYELLTGRPAWPGESFAEIVSARLVRPPPDPRVVRPIADILANVVLRCMARRREDRYGDARGALAAWDAATATDDIVASPPFEARIERPAWTGTSVAVLPIQNIGSPDEAFLADGVTDDLIDALSMTPNLRVRPRGMVARFTARDTDPREAGRALEVEAVVEASIRRTATGVRLSARLLGVVDGFQLWARRFDCAIGDLLVASDEAARAIAEALASRLDAPPRRAPTDGSAVELYLRARNALHRNWYTPSTEPITLFRDALERAPDDPLILAGFATARARYARTPGDLAEARALAQRAIAAGPHLGEPWVAMATLHRHEGDPLRQIAALARALAAAPRQVEAHHQLGRIWLEVGPLDRAVLALELAASLDPANEEICANLAASRYFSGDSSAADAMLNSDVRGPAAQQLFPFIRARMRLWGRTSEPNIETTLSAPRMYLELVDCAIRQGPLLAAAEADFARAMRRPGLGEQLLAELHFAKREVEAGVAYARKSVEAGLMDLVWFDACPLLLEAREHADWAALRARVVERADGVREAIAREGIPT